MTWWILCDFSCRRITQVEPRLQKLVLLLSTGISGGYAEHAPCVVLHGVIVFCVVLGCQCHPASFFLNLPLTLDTYTNTYSDAHAYVYSCRHTHMYADMYACVFAHTYTHIFMHVVYMHTHIFFYLCLFFSLFLLILFYY